MFQPFLPPPPPPISCLYMVSLPTNPPPARQPASHVTSTLPPLAILLLLFLPFPLLFVSCYFLKVILLIPSYVTPFTSSLLNFLLFSLYLSLSLSHSLILIFMFLLNVSLTSSSSCFIYLCSNISLIIIALRTFF